MKTMTRERWEYWKEQVDMAIDSGYTFDGEHMQELLSCITPIEDQKPSSDDALLRALGYVPGDPKSRQPHIHCPGCGPFVASDGDGCCVTCGATTRLIEIYEARPEQKDKPSEICCRTGVQNCHFCDDVNCGDNLTVRDVNPGKETK